MSAEKTQPHMMSACISQRVPPRRAMKRCSTMLCANEAAALRHPSNLKRGPLEGRASFVLR
jgi:hypothetical protein